MKRTYASILITNFNKGKFIQNSLKSCEAQNYKYKEVIIFDDCSTDNSLSIIKKFKKFKLIKNKKKKFKSGPLNQIYGINTLLKASKGDLIFLLDSDDEFKKDKIKKICDIFKKNKKLNFLQDTPTNNLTKKKIIFNKRKNIYTIWPKFYPTSTIVFRKKYYKNFLKFVMVNKYPNLEIDARLCIYAFLKGDFKVFQRSFTIYRVNTQGITSRYKKYGKSWWMKRHEAFNYMLYISKKLNLKFKRGPDFYLTKLVNFFF